METIWEENRYAEENIEWIKNEFPYLEAVTKGSYVNFPYGGLENYLEEYYGRHVKALTNIKTKYDPFNVFTFPQGIKKEGQDHQLSLPETKLLQKSDEDVTIHLDDASYRGFRYVSKRV